MNHSRNKARALRDAASIAKHWKAGESIRALMDDYRVGSQAIKQAILQEIGDDEYQRISNEHHRRRPSHYAERLEVHTRVRRSGKRDAKGYRTERRQRIIKVGIGPGRRNGWVTLATYLWEQHHKRKVPKGYYVGHEDGDSMNDSIDNLILVSGADRGRHMAKVSDHKRRAAKIRKAAVERFAAKRRLAEVRAQKMVFPSAQWDQDEDDGWYTED